MISNTTVKKRWKKVENTLQGRFSNKFMLSGGEIVNYGKWVISFAFALSLQSCLQTAVASSSSNPADIFSAIAFVILFICDSFRMYIPMLFCSGIIPTDPNFADRRIPKSVFYRFTSILFLSLCLFYYAASNHSSWLGYFIAIGAVQVIDLLWYLPIKSPLKTIHQTESAIQRRIKASHTWSVFLSKINFAIFAIKALFSRDKLEDIVAHKNHDITKRHQLLEEEAAKARANVESSLKWYLDRYESISNETNQIIASIKKDREYARIAGWDIVFCGFIVIVYLFGDSGLLITNYALVAGVSLHIYNIISDYCINSGEYVQMIRFAFAKEPNFSATTTTPHKKIDHTESIRSYGFHSSLLKNANNLIERNSSEKMSLFFSFTGNAISAETREIITELCRKNCVSGICTTGAGIEEDIIKCRYDFRELS